MDTPKPKRPRKKPGKVGEAKSAVVADLPMACCDERAALAFLEEQRWGSCPCCPHCGSVSVYRMAGESATRRGLWRCRDCKGQYTVRVGSVMEDSRIPLRHWCMAFWLLCASKKGCSAKQIQRLTGLSYRSALFLLHRVRFAMAPSPDDPKLSGTVEADETYIGGRVRIGSYNQRGVPLKRKLRNKSTVLAALERGGQVRARVVPIVTVDNVRHFLMDHVEPTKTELMTDEAGLYAAVGREFVSHRSVHHKSKEYVKPDGTSTNGVESYFSILKRGLHGVYHSVSPEHLHRYVGEFSFRHNTRKMEDGERTVLAIRQASGRRLRYRNPDAA